MSVEITKTNPFGSGHSKFIYACLERGLIKNYEDITSFLVDMYVSGLSCNAIADKLWQEHQLKVSSRNISDHVKKAGVIRTYQQAKVNAIKTGRMVYTKMSEEDRAKRKQVGFLTRMSIFQRDNFHCTLCGTTPTPGNRIEIHHKNFDETDNYQCNLQTVCYLCHKGLHAVQNNGIL